MEVEHVCAQNQQLQHRSSPICHQWQHQLQIAFFSLKKKFCLQGCRSESSLGGKSTVLELGTPEEEEVRKYIIILIYPHQILDSSVPSLLISSGTS